jgi:hypothetical protein
MSASNLKSTDRFKNAIEKYLLNLSQTNQQFAKMFTKENKNIDDCITYILNTVKASGSAGFAQNEIYGMAIHYYDEDNIVVGKPVECQVVLNEPVDLTEEEKAEAKERAIREIIDAEKKKLTQKVVIPNTNQKDATIIPINQAELF